MVCNKRLTCEEHDQDVRTIRLATASLDYEAGDVCVVWPLIDESIVRNFICESLRMQPERRVKISLRDAYSY